MKDIFEELIMVEGVNGVMFLSDQGKILYRNCFQYDANKIDDLPLAGVSTRMKLADEMELIFDNGRIYMRKMEDGVVVLFLSSFAPVAMIRMQCDMIRPQLQNHANGKKKSRFFKRF